MKMTPLQLVLGSLLVFWASISLMVLPAALNKPEPSEIWRPMTELEKAGHEVYVDNGCVYCHSNYIRYNDWGHGALRIAEAGDYVDLAPAQWGTERTGPDLSQEGGLRSDDWHVAHFMNPRNTSPTSVMPKYDWLGDDDIEKLIAYLQSRGGTMADERMERQRYWKQQAVAAYEAGADSNIAWLHSKVPEPWRAMPNPYPATDQSLLRGQKIYQQFCINCHGAVGDGQGPAAKYLYPPPLNFTTLRRNLVEDKYIGGILYYQIMNGITGTAMPYFKPLLESEKIWDVSNYVAVAFIGYSDADIDPEGIDAAYEESYTNPFVPPGSSTPPGPPSNPGEIGESARQPGPRRMADDSSPREPDPIPKPVNTPEEEG